MNTDMDKLSHERARRAHGRKWSLLINAIMVASGMFGAWLVNLLFQHRHLGVRIVLGIVYVGAIEGALYLFREGFENVYETKRERMTAFAGIVLLFAVMVANAWAHFYIQENGAITQQWIATFLHWGFVAVPFAVLGLGIWLNLNNPESQRKSMERRERGERSEFKTAARREALGHPVMAETKTLIAEMYAQAVAAEWMEEVRGEMPEAVRARIDAQMQPKRVAAAPPRPPVRPEPEPEPEPEEEFPVSLPPVRTTGKARANRAASNGWQ